MCDEVFERNFLNYFFSVSDPVVVLKPLPEFAALAGRAELEVPSKPITVAAPASASASASAANAKPATTKADLDLWRKRLMAAVAGYLTLCGESYSANYIKAVACRAAKKDDFNHIGLSQLRSLYNAFTKQQKDLKRVQNIK